ncbi:MAG: DNA internalization-related competence protein ComEC/Rec2 [Legionellaceae bacterium]|nr:DNA internalization-related competence protein ComEC/Rec2 [Legionellaceae bacterium]HCA89093.1 DNA internalization-related competence protein ComEC/Rec2 [Legionellales bacterium]
MMGLFLGMVMHNLPLWLWPVFLGLLHLFKAPLRMYAVCGMGFLWFALHAYLIQDHHMPAVNVLPYAKIVGYIASTPVVTDQKTQFRFKLTKLNGQDAQANILLTCYRHCPVFHLGERWALTAKLKKPLNLGNPGHFDYQQFLAIRHITWTGYLKTKHQALLANASGFWISKWRASLQEALSYLPATDLGLIEALTLGITNHIPHATWQLFRRTGTVHLLVISGAHIALLSSMVFWSVRQSLRYFGFLTQTIPVIQIAAAISVLSAFLYALLAGFAVPAQRAFMALCLGLLPLFAHRRLTVWQIWRYACVVVMLYEPHVVLNPGFYLSFLAVASLLLAQAILPFKSILKLLSLQLCCLIGLLPISLFLFSYGALNGVIANLVAIPWVGFGLVPLALLLLVMPNYMASYLLPLWHYLHGGLIVWLSWVDKLSWMNLTYTISSVFALCMVGIGLIGLFIFPLKKLRLVFIILVISALSTPHLRVKPFEAYVRVLDVGQGLAVVVHTTHHTLIYDTGAKYYKGRDMAELAIIPYLKTLGVTHLDKVVISHPDLDHRGGLMTLTKNYAIDALIVHDVAYYHQGYNCHTYPSWVWDGILFEFLAIKENLNSTNNQSCILKISTPTQAVLLVGDIEQKGEKYLVEHYGDKLKAQALVVAHHGSQTSSSAFFIDKVKPVWAFISAGIDNRYHFPHKKTLMTLTQAQAQILSTQECGMIHFSLNHTKKIAKPACFYDINK